MRGRAEARPLRTAIPCRRARDRTSSERGRRRGPVPARGAHLPPRLHPADPGRPPRGPHRHAAGPGELPEPRRRPGLHPAPRRGRDGRRPGRLHDAGPRGAVRPGRRAGDPPPPHRRAGALLRPPGAPRLGDGRAPDGAHARGGRRHRGARGLAGGQRGERPGQRLLRPPRLRAGRTQEVPHRGRLGGRRRARARAPYARSRLRTGPYRSARSGDSGRRLPYPRSRTQPSVPLADRRASPSARSASARDRPRRRSG